MPNPYTLSEAAAAFYEARAAEGIYPTELAMLCLRNEEERNGTLCEIERHKRSTGRPRKVPKTPLEAEQLAMKIRVGLERMREERAARAPRVEVPVHAETEVRMSPIRISLSYEECMARKSW